MSNTKQQKTGIPALDREWTPAETAEIEAMAATVESGGGNVFADTGVPDADERLFKCALGMHIRDLMQAKQLTQTALARLVGLDQADVSNLMRGRLSKFSVERLLGVVNRLGCSVEVRILPEIGAASAPSLRVVMEAA